MGLLGHLRSKSRQQILPQLDLCLSSSSAEGYSREKLCPILTDEFHAEHTGKNGDQQSAIHRGGAFCELRHRSLPVSSQVRLFDRLCQ